MKKKALIFGITGQDGAYLSKLLLKKGYIVRTRTDADTKEARHNNFIRRDMAFQSGAQILSTDYPVRNLRHSLDYFVRFKGNIKVRCNPKVNLNHCRLIDLKE